MKFYVLVFLCLIDYYQVVSSIEIRHSRDPKLLFGGYKITPRFCKPTRKIFNDTGGPNVCMFNHECILRQGEVVGACMDGFLFGACCHLAAGTTGELIQNASMNTPKEPEPMEKKPSPDIPSRPTVDITSSGIHHITQTLLNQDILHTIDNNAIVEVNDNENGFSTSGILHHPLPDTSISTEGVTLVTSHGYVTRKPTTESRKTTTMMEQSTHPYERETPLLTVSVSSPSYTAKPITTTFVRPMFHQKPSDTDKYVLVPTITKPEDTSSDSYPVIHLLDSDGSTNNPQYSTTSKKPLSTSYVYSSSTTSYKPFTSKKPPSTSYVFSTTIPPRRTTSSQTTTTKVKPSTTKKKGKPTKNSNKKTTKPSQGTSAYNDVTKPYTETTKKPPSTSYIYSSIPTRRPGSTIGVEGPGLSISSDPIPQYSSSTGYPSPAPTLIVLSPITEEDPYTRPVSRPPPYSPSYPSTYQQTAATKPPRKPVNQVTINNHVTQNIYPGSRPTSVGASSLGYMGSSEKPSPTVLITPKPNIASSSGRPTPFDEYVTAGINVEPSVDDQLVNFPPVRNPNLNMSLYGDHDVTTPEFAEDELLDEKMESFVNKIIQGLQEPFQDLKDVVYNQNKTKPIKKQGTTTKKPVTKPARPGTTSRPVRPSSTRPLTSSRPSPSRPTSLRPATSSRPPVRPSSVRPSPSVRPTANRITTTKVTTRRPTRRPSSTATTINTTKKPVTPKKPSKSTRRPTTTESLIEKETISPSVFTDDYKRECGRRPLIKTGRIVGGREATFGKWPWQVLVRESTWLGLFTKNKCGGVLISNKYVLTAAHCQPGFLASLVAVFGEFDISGELESKRSQSRNVKRVIVNRGYDPLTFENDLALLELESPIKFDQHIIPICLPRESEDFTGRMATVTGWGRLKYNGGVPSVLQEVQVPIMENSVCQEMFRTAAHSKIILDSFLCAGYANGQKDSCEGDSGGPLVLPRSDGRYQLAGTVSHGVKCASPYLPGVYMRTQWFKPWIESITGIN
ncbi:serine protease filzig [Coccinella septempunctata]|uniref:serine protease filzig n=1 Tax=Coccinella septempunctata TaxID=41139 RepID=UPI001D080BD0|nr:serine protease filzig [Coccinella septempunctata]